MRDAHGDKLVTKKEQRNNATAGMLTHNNIILFTFTCICTSRGPGLVSFIRSPNTSNQIQRNKKLRVPDEINDFLTRPWQIDAKKANLMNILIVSNLRHSRRKYKRHGCVIHSTRTYSDISLTSDTSETRLVPFSNEFSFYSFRDVLEDLLDRP